MKTQDIVLFFVLLMGIPLLVMGCPGGECAYDDYPGTCTAVDDNLFTFEGTINGQAVKAEGNPLPEGSSKAVGSTWACSLMSIQSGSCTPCLFDLGPAEKEAWAICRSLIGE